ncbi:MAG: hypothetical protein LCH69_02370 [Proteobacteria bacterium]|nr:hypothetical protein [Pseudomonadota bacterium]
MKARDISAVLLAGLLTLGAANGQTPPPAAAPHHPAPEGSAAPEAAPGQGQMAPAAGAGMMNMMSPEMMQMMMRMMAQHDLAGQMPMQGMAGGMPPGMADGAGPGPEVILGLVPAAPPEMTPERVRSWLQERLDRLGNPRLTLGAIGEAPDGSITAEIRTVDGSLVQKLAFNRYPGFVRQID